jgi:hypothetical protein
VGSFFDKRASLPNLHFTVFKRFYQPKIALDLILLRDPRCTRMHMIPTVILNTKPSRGICFMPPIVRPPRMTCKARNLELLSCVRRRDDKRSHLDSGLRLTYLGRKFPEDIGETLPPSKSRMNSVLPIERNAVVAGERHAVPKWLALAEKRLDYPVQRDNSVSQAVYGPQIRRQGVVVVAPIVTPGVA